MQTSSMTQSSMALGAGTATAVMLPKWIGSDAVGLTAAGAYAAAQALDGDAPEMITLPATGAGEEVDRAIRVGAATLGWVLAHSVAVPVLRALPLPRPLVAAAAGYAVAQANEKLSALTAGQRPSGLRAAPESL